MDLAIDPRLRDDKSIVLGDNADGSSQPAHAQTATPVRTDSHSRALSSIATGTPSATTASTGQSYGAPQTPHTPTTAHLSSADNGSPLDGSDLTPHDPHDPNDPNDPNDPKRPRACEACRGLKVKCEPDASNPDGPCKRCAKAGRSCVVTQPTRKRQKKTDSRVAELEKKIDALTASLQASRGGTGTAGGFRPAEEQNAHSFGYGGPPRGWGAPPPREVQPQYAPEPEKPAATPTATAGQKRKFIEDRDSLIEALKPCAPRPANKPQEDTPDIIDRGIVTLAQANDFFIRYTDHMIYHLPAVVFPIGTTCEEIRKSKPVLFLAVIAAACSEYPNMQRVLAKELLQIFADKVLVLGEKSLELVQALQIGTIWYYPPEHFEELKFYQLIHVCAVMAIDIGLGKKKATSKSGLIPYSWRDDRYRKTPFPDPTTIESQRAWLASYFLAENVSMALHRPNLIRWSPFMADCLDALESSPDAAPTDKYLCQLVWTQRLAEEVSIQFSMDDPSLFINVAEPKVQHALRGFERDLTKYSDSVPKSGRISTLQLGFHVLDLYMHEIALYVDKDESPRRLDPESLREPLPGLSESLTTAHISALSSCLMAIDGIFDTFLSMSVHAIRCLPVFNFVRVAYGVVVLLKMYFSASTPDSELGKVINKDHMKVEEYLGKLLERFREAAQGDRCRPAAKFLVVLAMLRNWFQKQGSQDVAAPSNSNDSAVKTAESTPAVAQQQNEYNPANTPLQLLSEIATGNDARGNQNQQSTGPANPGNTQPFAAWPQNPNGPQPYMFDPVTGAPSGGINAQLSGHLHGVMPYLNNTFNADLDYSNLGEGFEQAMGLTLTGFGGNGDPGYENGLGFVVGDQLLGPMLEHMPGVGLFQF